MLQLIRLVFMNFSLLNKLSVMSNAFTGSVPANYDKYLGPVMFEPYALDIAGRLKNEELKQVLELACGTGRVTRHLVSLLGKDGRLVATDLNADMMAMAQASITGSSVQWQVADAQQLPFENESFDHVICQFGVMFFRDKQKAFEEVYRVLQDEGKFIFNVWDEMLYNPRSFVLSKVMDDMFGEDAPDFMKKGPFSFFDKEEIGQMLRAAGFKKVEINVVEKTSRYSSVEDFVTGTVDGSPLYFFLQKQPAAVSEEVKQKLREELAVQAQQYGSQIPLRALLIEAVK
jgi:ubiquinone/menaquinone biosynthesis C-methylase UbiE